MANAAAIHATVQRIYDAALTASAWQPVLESVVDLMGSNHAMLFAHDPGRANTPMAKSAGMDERIERVDTDGITAADVAKRDEEWERARLQAILDGLAKLTELERKAVTLWLVDQTKPDCPSSIGKLAEKIYGPATTEAEKQKNKCAFRHRRDAGLKKLRAHLIRLGYWHDKRP